MILNTFAVLDVFVTLVRLVLALLIVVLAAPAWRAWRQARTEGCESLENRTYLLHQLTLLLLFLNVASWPLFYLLLESYVPEWPGVMCIYGVTQVGAGSLGPSRFLPALLLALQMFKPALVFGSGALAVLYLANRKTAHSPLMGRILFVLIGLGLLAAVDCVAEIAYLAIPKKDDLPDTGCCTGRFGDDIRLLPTAILGEVARPWLRLTFYGVNVCMISALFVSIQRLSTGRVGMRPCLPERLPQPRLGVLLVGSAINLAVSAAFLVDVAAPVWLRLPHHHCPYDLLGRAPEAVLGVASFLGGTFAVGWACVAGWFANCPETQPTLTEQVRKLLTVGLFGYAGFLVMVTIELILA